MIEEYFKLTDILIYFIKKHYYENNNIKFTYTKVLLYT